MPFVVTSACIDTKDRSCVDACPVDCLYEGGRMMYIHPTECIDCGACEPVCPVDAIYWVEELPTELSHFTSVNAEFFGDEVTGWGDPGGAYYTGSTTLDHPVVASHPAES